LNQFLGFNWFLYFVKSSLPTSKPPLQNTTSINTRLVVEAITLVLVGRSKSGMIKVAAKKTPEKIMRNIPSFICRFFEFFMCFKSLVHITSFVAFCFLAVKKGIIELPLLSIFILLNVSLMKSLLCDSLCIVAIFSCHKDSKSLSYTKNF